MALLAVPAAWAQPVQKIPPITPMAHEIYSISHQDMSWHEHEYRIFMAAPKQASPNAHKPAALYILDGNAQFPLAVNAAQKQWEQASETPNQSAQLPLIVGLGYPETTAYPQKARTRDYTYAAPGEAFADGGGAADFYRFLDSQVRPYINKRFATDPERQILSGHSFAGLFTLFVLLNHAEKFNHYIIGSPSLWWGKGAIVTNAKMPAQAVRSATILQGEYEENPKADPNITPERLARIQNRSSAMTARQLTAWLQNHNINSHFILVPKSNHGAVIPAVIETAVRTALNGY
ncbi:MAG: alpha/beta hydrolase [Alcaligenaceae bacterium]|nr:alpha/beta hydrolase [Alcaligenaceae bacterium]